VINRTGSDIVINRINNAESKRLPSRTTPATSCAA
jgi:hypothetical protein